MPPAQPRTATCYWASPCSCPQPRLQGQQLPNEANHLLLPSCPPCHPRLHLSAGVNDFHTLPKAQLIPVSRVQPVTKLCQLPLLNIFWQSKKKARHKRPHTVGVYLYGMSRIGKCRETEVDWWLPGAGRGGNGELLCGWGFLLG